jgi:hypothetical protein
MSIGTDLTTVSTFGWFSEEDNNDLLLSVATFGWYALLTEAEAVEVIFDFLLCIMQSIDIELIK